MTNFLIAVISLSAWFFNLWPVHRLALLAIGIVFGLIWFVSKFWKILLILGIVAAIDE